MQTNYFPKLLLQNRSLFKVKIFKVNENYFLMDIQQNKPKCFTGMFRKGKRLVSFPEFLFQPGCYESIVNRTNFRKNLHLWDFCLFAF